MGEFVVDTNVLGVANSREVAEANCAAACVEALGRIIERGVVVLDDGWWILEEYLANASSSGEPGAGDAFLRWVLTNTGNSDRCRLVTITRSGQGCDEFPATAELDSFDTSDRKFVCISVVSGAPILVALDRGWWQHREALAQANVEIEYLCAADMEAIAARRATR